MKNKIRTNNQWRALVSFWELSPDEQVEAMQFCSDPENIEQEKFVCYKGMTISLQEFLLVADEELLAQGWVGIYGLSNTGAVVIKVDDRQEAVVCGILT